MICALAAPPVLGARAIGSRVGTHVGTRVGAQLRSLRSVPATSVPAPEPATWMEMAPAPSPWNSSWMEDTACDSPGTTELDPCGEISYCFRADAGTALECLPCGADTEQCCPMMEMPDGVVIGCDNGLVCHDSRTCGPPAPPSEEDMGNTTARYGQCGGALHTGPTECDIGLVCAVKNKYYSQCVDDGIDAGVAEYLQCDGEGYKEPLECDTGLTCAVINEFYSQCVRM